MSERIFGLIEKILSQNGARFRVINHANAGTSEEVARVRGTALGQGAKALICRIKGAKYAALSSMLNLSKAEISTKKENFSELNRGENFWLNLEPNNSVNINVVAVLPADLKANLNALALCFEAKKASLASPAEVRELTECEFGAIPPFSFHEKLLLVADERLFTRFDEIAFNAGLLNRSIVLNSSDYRQIVRPLVINFAD